MKLSVAMCTYNGAMYLPEQLDSIAAQTRQPDELIVCDDGSTDGTPNVVRAFAAQMPFPVRVHVNAENLGSTRNFEQAIGLCTGDLIALADQDDWWHPDKLRRLEEALRQRGDAGLVFSDGEIVDQHLRPLGLRLWQAARFGEAEQKLFAEGEGLKVLLSHNVVTGAAMAFRTEFRKFVLPIPEDLMQDGMRVLHDGWIALIISAIAEIIFVPEPLFKYRQHSRQQLGVRPAPGVEAHSNESSGVATAIRAAARRRNSFAVGIHYDETVHRRLSAHADMVTNKKLLNELGAKVLHQKARAAMPEEKLKRVPLVLRELLALRYHIYSNGVYSAAKDLWL